MENFVNILKMVSGSMSSVLIIVGFAVWLIKPVRTAVSRWVMKTAHTDQFGGR